MRIKNKDEIEAHILQRLKETAMKSTHDQLCVLVKYHVKQDEMILNQREAAEVI
jgi:hypothetical protein